MTKNKQKFEALIGQVEVWRQELGVPGAAFGLIVEDEEFTVGLGVTSVENPLPVNEQTIFQIGSITKTVTATLMMRLVEQGKLDLDAPVRKYLPDFKVKDETVSETITVRHLITHSAGWVGDVFTDTGMSDDALPKYIAAMADLEQLAPPDTAISYNNAAFCVAGGVIEAVTGQKFEQAMQELIFEPLELNRSFFYPHDVMVHRFVVGHRVGKADDTENPQETQTLSPWPLPRAINPAGGIACDIRDLLKYGRYHLGNGKPLLTADSLEKMHTPVTHFNDDVSVGLAWIIREIGGIKTLGHTGGTVGQLSLLMLIPEHNAVMAITTNAENGSTLNTRFNKYVLKEFFGVEVPEPQPIESSIEQLAEYAGKYSRPLLDIDLKLEGEELKAYITVNSGLPNDDPAPSPPPMTLVRCGEDQLLVVDGAMKDVKGDIIRDETGTIRYLRLGSRINPRVD